MSRRRFGVAPLDGIALLPPPLETFVEDLVIPPPVRIEDVAGPPGQRVRAGSVEDHAAGPRDLLRRARLDDTDRHRPRALDVHVAVLLPAADVDHVDLGAAVE